MADDEILRRLDAHLELGNAHMERGNAHMERGNQLMEEIREEHRLNRREHERNRRAYAEISATNKAVLRDLTGEIRTMREESRVHHEAMVGALTDLAREIRSWGGGAAPA